MLARLIKQGKDMFLLCWDGTVATATPYMIKRFLTEFKQIETVTDPFGPKWAAYPPGSRKDPEIVGLLDHAINAYPGKTLAYVTEEKRLHILDPIVFQDVLAFMAPDEYLTTKEYAQKQGVSAVRIKNLCQEGRLPGAMHKGNQWLIPRTAKYPDDRRVKCKY